MLLLAYVAPFLGQLHFWRTYFFRVSTFSEQLVLQSNQFDTTATSAEQLFLQTCYFLGTTTFPKFQFLLRNYFFQNSNLCRSKLLPSCYLLRIVSSLGQLLFRRASLLRIKISIEELFFETGTSIQHQIFQNGHPFKKASSSKDRHFINFFRKATFLKTPNFAKKQYSATYFFRRDTFTQLHSFFYTFPQLRFLSISQYILPLLVTYSDSRTVIE